MNKNKIFIAKYKLRYSTIKCYATLIIYLNILRNIHDNIEFKLIAMVQLPKLVLQIVKKTFQGIR